VVAVSARPILAWGKAGRALGDAPESGDLHVVAPFDDGALVALIDGLGHGPEAAVAARAAAEILSANPAEPVRVLVERCHEGLRRTRGAVLSLAAFDARTSTMTWAGVGNVDAVLVRAAPARPPREALGLRGGVVGYNLPSFQPATLPVAPGDTLVLATDGIKSTFHGAVPLDFSPAEIAESILALHGRDDDDALVLVARYQGGPS
jgi:negative regulator of sigma-B (phosphoserine phosphatase)